MSDQKIPSPTFRSNKCSQNAICTTGRRMKFDLLLSFWLSLLITEINSKICVVSDYTGDVTLFFGQIKTQSTMTSTVHTSTYIIYDLSYSLQENGHIQTDCPVVKCNVAEFQLKSCFFINTVYSYSSWNIGVRERFHMITCSSVTQ